MNDKEFEQMIIQALEALEQGQTIDQALALFPDSEAELRPALETAVMLDGLRVAHSNKAQADSKQRFLAQAEALQEKPKKARSVIGFWRRWASPLAFVATLILVLGMGTILASQSALPGDVLYGPKLIFEGVRLSLVRDLQEQELLQRQFEFERLREIQVLIANGREAEVILNGTIESIDEENWIVEGIPVMLGDETIIDGTPEVGAEVQIKGETGLNELYAQEITVSVVGLPAPAPTATPDGPSRPEISATNTPESVMPPGNQPNVVDMTATSSPTPSSTPTATATATATATSTATRTPVATYTPSATPTIADTATPEPPTPNPLPTDDGGNNNNNNSNNNDNTNTNTNTNDNINTNTNTNDNTNNNNSSGPGNENETENNNNNNNNNSSGSVNGNGNYNNSGPGEDGGINSSYSVIPAILLGLAGVVILNGGSEKLKN